MSGLERLGNLGLAGRRERQSFHRRLSFFFTGLLVVSVVLTGNSYVVATEVEEIEEAIQEKEGEKQQKEGELEESEQKEEEYKGQEVGFGVRVADLSEELNEVEEQLEQKQQGVEVKEAELEELNESLQTEKEVQGTLAYDFYKLTRYGLIEILFGSEGVSEFIRTLSFRKVAVGLQFKRLAELSESVMQMKDQFDVLTCEKEGIEEEARGLEAQKEDIENQLALAQTKAAYEASRQQQLTGEIENITAEQAALIKEKMAATEKATSIGEYEDVKAELPDPPFSPAYAVASIGYPHRIGMNQYGAYGRSKAGQNYTDILSAYYNANLAEGYPVPDQINVEGYGWMDFEGQYMKGIAEMPTSWAGTGGFEALRAQAVAARSYALAVTNDGQNPICATQSCQVYNHGKASNPAAAEWHRAVEETHAVVLTYEGAPIPTYYASTAGGYTRLPSDFDIHWSSSSPPYLKRVKDFSGDGKAYDGPGYGGSPWYYKVWYAQSDLHPWLTDSEMKDLLNSALLPDDYISYLSHPDLGRWTHEEVVAKLGELGITPIPDISSITVLNSGEGYTATLRVGSSAGVIDVGGWRFNKVYKLRSRGHLALWSSLYDVIMR